MLLLRTAGAGHAQPHAAPPAAAARGDAGRKAAPAKDPGGGRRACPDGSPRRAAPHGSERQRRLAGESGACTGGADGCRPQCGRHDCTTEAAGAQLPPPLFRHLLVKATNRSADGAVRCVLPVFEASEEWWDLVDYLKRDFKSNFAEARRAAILSAAMGWAAGQELAQARQLRASPGDAAAPPVTAALLADPALWVLLPYSRPLLLMVHQALSVESSGLGLRQLAQTSHAAASLMLYLDALSAPLHPGLGAERAAFEDLASDWVRLGHERPANDTLAWMTMLALAGSGDEYFSNLYTSAIIAVGSTEKWRTMLWALPQLSPDGRRVGNILIDCIKDAPPIQIDVTRRGATSYAAPPAPRPPRFATHRFGRRQLRLKLRARPSDPGAALLGWLGSKACAAHHLLALATWQLLAATEPGAGAARAAAADDVGTGGQDSGGGEEWWWDPGGIEFGGYVFHVTWEAPPPASALARPRRGSDGGGGRAARHKLRPGAGPGGGAPRREAAARAARALCFCAAYVCFGAWVVDDHWAFDVEYPEESSCGARVFSGLVIWAPFAAMSLTQAARAALALARAAAAAGPRAAAAAAAALLGAPARAAAALRERRARAAAAKAAAAAAAKAAAPAAARRQGHAEEAAAVAPSLAAAAETQEGEEDDSTCCMVCISAPRQFAAVHGGCAHLCVCGGCLAALRAARKAGDATAPWPAPPPRRACAARAAAAAAGGGDAPADDDNTGGAFGDKWENTLAVHHTLSSLYTPKARAGTSVSRAARAAGACKRHDHLCVVLEPFKQLDHLARRKDKELKEICEAARKLGIDEAAVRANAAALEGLVPGLAPNLDKMKASDWATLLRDTGRVVGVVIALRGALPGADLGVMVGRQPRLLLREGEDLARDAAQAKAMLSRCPNPDLILQEVPDLLNAAELEQALAHLRRCFPKDDPFVLLQAEPSILRNIGGEVDLEADPSYGLPTNDPTAAWPALDPDE
ncbi:MAG: hypothetical protein J3K34DRAFT_525099 [Monoraphidium minutum]|nr:MAG: hypothetical protein J3K34DRAFT_525099 [Monoraphidium minutum]